jgi:hypothetical protein
MRHPNHRLVKIHRSYTVEEAAARLQVHRNTVREWIRRGLPTCDDKRPSLILGRELVAYLQARRTRNRRTCGPGEIYCVRCRAPRKPAGDMADYLSRTGTVGDLVGICNTCDAVMYRRVNHERLPEIRGLLDVRLPQAGKHIVEIADPSVNSALRPRARR